MLEPISLGANVSVRHASEDIDPDVGAQAFTYPEIMATVCTARCIGNCIPRCIRPWPIDPCLCYLATMSTCTFI